MTQFAVECAMRSRFAWNTFELAGMGAQARTTVTTLRGPAAGTTSAPIPAISTEREGRVVTTAPVTNLPDQYAREEVIWQIKERVIDFLPVRVGSGPWDLDPTTTDACIVCGEFLIDRVDEIGNISALGFGVYAKSRWIVAHTACVRRLELAG